MLVFYPCSGDIYDAKKSGKVPVDTVVRLGGGGVLPAFMDISTNLVLCFYIARWPARILACQDSLLWFIHNFLFISFMWQKNSSCAFFHFTQNFPNSDLCLILKLDLSINLVKTCGGDVGCWTHVGRLWHGELSPAYCCSHVTLSCQVGGLINGWTLVDVI